MTHDELLEQLNWAVQEYDRAYDNTNYYYTALRAVVELHKPWDETKYGYDYCKACETNGLGYRNYPCPTIQAIEKELV